MHTFNYYLGQLSEAMQRKILRYRHWQDAHRSLLGKALLIRGLKELALKGYSMPDLKFTAFERPYFDDRVDFNIAHSGRFIVCALSLTNKVGIDVEEIKPISLEDFEANFSEEEWIKIYADEDQYRGFYKFWTKKEAFLKAIGLGLNVPLREAEVLGDTIEWNGQVWFLQEMELDKEHVFHLSSNGFRPELMIRQLDFNDKLVC
jgi:4'-phosphopantetheinyl transferase